MSIVADEALLQEARQYKTELIAKMFGISVQSLGQQEPTILSAVPQQSNIVGVGYGAKTTEGAGIAEEVAVRVYVRTKLPRSSLSKTEEIPSSVNGLPTDVIPVGDLTVLQRPTACGVSVGHYQITAGTLGCLVKRVDADSSERYILSNNHVLANSNDANKGDKILEPGPLDGGSSDNPIAELTDFEPINFQDGNKMDAAIARLLKETDVTSQILTIRQVQQPPMASAIYQSVRKHGRTTLHTIGVIMAVSVDIRVRYGKQLADFEEQLEIAGVGGVFSSGGDSGSLIVDAVTKCPVSLLFAGGLGKTFANPIEPILKRFNIEIL